MIHREVTHADGVAPGWNLVMHVAALVLSVYLRLSWGGWETVAFALSIIGPVAMLLPSLVALGVRRRHRLGANVWVPLAAASGSMVLAGALLVGAGDLPAPTIPLFELLGLPWNRDEWGAWTNPIGLACAVVFLVFLGWALLEVAASGFAARGERPMFR
ncbi:hypothetical protein [Saccharothrix sp. Mg75]|uniref:hypothetical protein n=1 Tax=Saccharothrix sp. Mg75 TaxID=3445357 RepID=UPI003EEC76F1